MPVIRKILNLLILLLFLMAVIAFLLERTRLLRLAFSSWLACIAFRLILRSRLGWRILLPAGVMGVALAAAVGFLALTMVAQAYQVPEFLVDLGIA